AEIGQLSRLRKLSVRASLSQEGVESLTGFPSSLFHFLSPSRRKTSEQSSDWDLSLHPPSFSPIPSFLHSNQLWDNQLTTLPAEIGQLSDLIQLSVRPSLELKRIFLIFSFKSDHE